MPDVEFVLSRLERVRKCGTGWTARCPAHEDRTASLSVAVGLDGCQMLHCFAGCSIGDITSAIGLTISDLFPRRPPDFSPEGRRKARRLATMADWSAALGVLEREAGVVLIAGSDLANGQPLASHDHQRLILAIERIESARRVLIGGRHD
ncbi:MAG: CHC2 zinc finger domain-containing protein [Lysobacterales bacterium]